MLGERMLIQGSLAAAGARLAVWSFVAFWLWLGLALVLRRLRLPLALAVAAVLSWVGAGLSLHWLLSVVGEWIARGLHVPRGF